MKEIIIGSDEIILWLRKNRKAGNISNEIIGKKIRKILKENFEINPIRKNSKSFWSTKNSEKSIDRLKLPKTSAQYSIEIEHIEKIYSFFNDEF